MQLKPRPPKPGTIYFVTDGSEFVKIGNTSNNIHERIGTLQVGNPRTLKLIAKIECDDVRVVERHIHRMFAKKRHIGEWFHISTKDVFRCVIAYEKSIKNGAVEAAVT
jgi:hypothetical protein